MAANLSPQHQKNAALRLKDTKTQILILMPLCLRDLVVNLHRFEG